MGGAFEVIGVGRNCRLIYPPLAQTIDRINRLTPAVGTNGDRMNIAGAVRPEVRAASGSLLVTGMTTTLLTERLLSTLAGFFGVVALLLASFGVYGVLSYAVVRRTNEIGIRIALGANHRVLTWRILRDALTTVGIGIALGIPAIATALVPARRAARVDPMAALRGDSSRTREICLREGGNIRYDDRDLKPMWQQTYTPIADSLALSTLVAALPILVLLLLLGVLRKPSWVAALSGLAAACLVALAGYGMPVTTMVSAVGYGAAFGLFPIGWIVFTAILLYRITLETGNFEIIKDSVGSLTSDHRVQALLIAFAFGAFIEGAAGFGTPVAVAAAMLTGLGFSPFYAAGICLLANTAPVAFGSIGIPLVTLQGITGLPMHALSTNVGRICAPVSLIIPAYLVVVMSGFRGLAGVLPAAAVCGIAFASAQLLVSNYLGPYLTDIIGSLASIISLVVLLRFWKPSTIFHLDGKTAPPPPHHPFGKVLRAWSPYLLLVFFVLVWGQSDIKAALDAYTMKFGWPGLHNLVERVPPVVAKNSAYAAIYNFNWLTASGTACLFATFVSALLLKVKPAHYAAMVVGTCRQLALSMVTIASVLGLAFLMNYSGATATLGLAFAATGVAFPFFSAMLGWLGVFLTGSDTSANALFGNLQVVTATELGLSPTLMAASNSSGGVMGKMISLQSIAVAAAATGMLASDESKLFRFTLKHSILLASVIGVIVTVYAYLIPWYL